MKYKKGSLLVLAYGIMCLCMGLAGCGTSVVRETAAAVAEKRNEDEIEQMRSSALEKEIARANACILRARPYLVESEEMKKWAEILFEGNPAYEPRVVFSNREDAQRINELEWKETDWEFHDGAYYRWDVNPNTGKPDNYGITRCLQLETVLDEKLAYLRWEQNEELLGTLYFGRFVEHLETGMLDWPDEYNKELIRQKRNTISLKEAEELACQTLKEMGINHYSICKSVMTKGYYTISFVMTHDGKTMLPERTTDYLSGDDAELSYYPCEMLTISIVNDKIRSIEWNNPLEIIAEEEFFLSDEMLFRLNEKYSTDLEGYILGAPTEAEREVGIDEKWFRVQANDNEGEFWIVPCWKKQ